MKFHPDTVRFSAFASHGSLTETALEPQAFWGQLTDQPALEVTQHPVQQSFVVNGDIAPNVTMNLLVGPQRREVAFSATAGSPNFPLVEESEDFLRLIESIREKFYKTCFQATRIAMGGSYVTFYENDSEAIKIFENLIPSLKFDGQQLSDFLYRSNRQTKSSVVKDLTLNRIGSWSYVHLFGMTDGVPFTSRRGIRVELDINSDVQGREPLGDKIIELGAELHQITLNRLVNGDRP